MAILVGKTFLVVYSYRTLKYPCNPYVILGKNGTLVRLFVYEYFFVFNMKAHKAQAAMTVFLVIGVILVAAVAYLIGHQSGMNRNVESTILQHELDGDMQNSVPMNTESSTVTGSGDGVTQESPTLTQAQATALVASQWSWQNSQEFRVTVTITQQDGQYRVTAIGSGGDDSIASTRRIATAAYANGSWTLGPATVDWSCYAHRGGHTNFSTVPCP